MLTASQRARIEREIKNTYECAHDAIDAIRDSRRMGYSIGERAAMQTLRDCRRQIRERRRAIREGRRV